MKLLDLLNISTKFLEKSGTNDPAAEAEILILHAAGIDRLTAYRDNAEVGQDLLSEIQKLLDRRAIGEPVQYIIGQVSFLNLKIMISKGILIPRPETELLAREAINEIRSQKSKVRSQKKIVIRNPKSEIHSESSILNSELEKKFRILDLCSGSGCISLSLAREFPDTDIYGTDISEIAIRYAKINADVNGIKNATYLQGSLFEPVKGPLIFDLIVSNPPYIRTSEISELQREIKEWEPLEALDGGIDGLDFYRKILLEAGKYIKNNGKIILEVGFDQAKAVTDIAKGYDLKNVTRIKDFAGIERILKAEK